MVGRGSARRALWRALVDLYHHSLGLLALNFLFAAAAMGSLMAATYVQAALALLLGLGPLAAAVAHVTLRVAVTDELLLGDAVEGLRRHWRRGLAVGAMVAGSLWPGLVAIEFYSRHGAVLWPLAALAAYLLAGFLLLQVWLWPRAIARPEQPLLQTFKEAAAEMLRRPVTTLGVGLALAVVNLMGAVLVLPLLTLTVSYSFLTAAHLAMPEELAREAEATWPR